MADVYLYGMILATTSFLLKDGFVKPDDYSEIDKKYTLPGGETGTCATVLDSLGLSVCMDGNHIGTRVAPVIKEFYQNKKVSLDSLYFDLKYEGLEDYVIIADGVRTPMGAFGDFYGSGRKQWNCPREEDIQNCKVAGIDPFFGEESEIAARYCVKNGVQYVTIDCPFDSYLHQHAAISVISGEGIQNHYPGKTREELFSQFCKSTEGLTIMTSGSKGNLYGRKGEDGKILPSLQVPVVSTLGAGDTFKAGCIYALLQGMEDDQILKWANACSAQAITVFPLPLNPPTLEQVRRLYE